MSKRPIVTKSRVVLIIALIVGAALEGTAFYLNNSSGFSSPNNPTPSPTAPGPTATPMPSPAFFEESNLTIVPYEVGEGQPVNVSVSVSNTGGLVGSVTLNLTVDGVSGEEQTVTLAGNESKTLHFGLTAGKEGTYILAVGDASGSLSVKATPPPPLPPGLVVSNLFTDPLEAWPDQPVTISFDLVNTGNENVVGYPLPVVVNGQQATVVNVTVAPGSTQHYNATVNGTEVGKYTASIIGYSAAPFNIVPTGKHTLHYIANRQQFPFTLDGVEHTSTYVELLDVGPHTIVAPETVVLPVPAWGNVLFTFSSWDDGTESLTRTINLQKEKYIVAYYTRAGSCPALYVWNGTAFNYEAEVSDGTGWLGFIDHFNADGSVKYSFNYPWDYVKIDSVIQPKDGYFAMNIMETSDEIFYLDSAKLIAVDHPANVDVFSTTSTYIYNLTGQGTIYTVSKNPLPPVSATDSSGQSILSQISKIDGVTTAGARWQWNSLNLNLGNLANAKEIKLIVAATINWPTTQQGGTNFMSFASKPGITPSPPPYIEVKDANGNWVRVQDSRQFPLPDVTTETFVVNLTGLFPTNDYSIRINTYQNITFDYIGVDSTPQQNIIVHTISPSKADFQQVFWSGSNSTGNFTKYGDVTQLVQSDDNKFVIGREGDGISLIFPANQTPVPQGMVRDYFLVSSVWFKGKGLPYLPFAVDPLPFQGMSSFPYSTNETYPYDGEHLKYLSQYNTRSITTQTYFP